MNQDSVCEKKLSEDSDVLDNSSVKHEKLYHDCMLFFLTSFIGWIVETLYGLTCVGLTDRGFLITPICPIYGFSFFAIYYTIKTPKQSYWNMLYNYLVNKTHNNKLTKKLVKFIVYILYFIATVLIATCLEFVVGLILDKAWGIRLWDYREYKYNLMGYVTIEFSIYWGILATIFMTSIFPLLNVFVNSIPMKKLKKYCDVLIGIVFIDVMVNLGYIAINGKNLVLFKDIKLEKFIKF